MNDFAKRIEKNLLKKKSKSAVDSFEGVVFYLIKKTNMSLSDIMEAPTPMILSMALRLQEYYEEKNKQMKKKR